MSVEGLRYRHRYWLSLSWITFFMRCNNKMFVYFYFKNNVLFVDQKQTKTKTKNPDTSIEHLFSLTYIVSVLLHVPPLGP